MSRAEGGEAGILDVCPWGSEDGGGVQGMVGGGPGHRGMAQGVGMDGEASTSLPVLPAFRRRCGHTIF